MTADAPGTVCVYVVGMHRSGTSATAGFLAQLGLGMPTGDDLVPAEESNELGHWESRSLLRLSNRLVRHFGGTWSIPPRLSPGWQDDPALDGLRAQARLAFATAFAGGPIAFKDPRLCITLPFWQTVVQAPSAAVFVLRDPTEVADSLRARSGLRIVHALAMWDRHVRSAAANLRGLPTLVVDYGDTLADPAGWSRRLVDFLGDVGVEVDPGRRDSAEAFLDAGLRHHHAPPAAPPGPADSSRRLFDVLVARHGAHRAWSVPDVGPEPEWVDDVLDLVAELEALHIAYGSLQRSRAFRVARTFWKLGGTVPEGP
jgi:hypothetical protein